MVRKTKTWDLVGRGISYLHTHLNWLASPPIKMRSRCVSPETQKAKKMERGQSKDFGRRHQHYYLIPLLRATQATHTSYVIFVHVHSLPTNHYSHSLDCVGFLADVAP